MENGDMIYALYRFLYSPDSWLSFTRVFQYITFRTAYAAITSGVLCWVLGKVFIPRFRRWRIAQISSRKDLDFQDDKQGTPTMGGLLIVASISVATVLWANLYNRFVLMALFVLTSLGLLGSLDDWIQMRYEKKSGLSARTKFTVQAIVGLLVGFWLIQQPMPIRLLWLDEGFRPELSQHLFMPFFKSVTIPLDYLYVPFVTIVIIGSSNAVNLTDGIDGLAIGCVVFAAVAYGAMAYVSGHYVFSEYLQVPDIRGSGELTTFVASVVGAGLGFLWFNAYPAQIFMGDAGSLSLGGAIGTIAVIIKQELLLMIVGGIFVIEALSVIIQVASYQITGNRLFEMAPLHHHFELKGMAECKITIRFWIVSIILALLALSTLKLR